MSENKLNKTVYILAIEHEHGINVWAFSSPANRDKMLVAYVNEWWDKDGPNKTKPGDNEELIDEYFFHADSIESYTLHEAEIDAGLLENVS